MNFIQLKIVNFVKKNLEIFLLIFLLIISIIITQLYNFNTKKIQNDYLEILRNSYFKKSVNHFFSNLKPKFENIEYRIQTGDSLVSILNNLYVNKSDIQKVISLLKNSNSLNLMQNQVIKLTLENTNNFKSISNILKHLTLPER